MQWDTPRGKVTARKEWKLKQGMIVQFGSFINHTTHLTQDMIEFRVRVIKASDVDVYNAPSLYLCHFEAQPIGAVIGNVIVPAEGLLQWRRSDDRPLDYREIALQAILCSELLEIRFELGGEKNLCSLWFRCIKERPECIIPKNELESYFEKL